MRSTIAGIKTSRLLAVVCLGVGILLLSGVLWWGQRARITGATAQERMACIVRVSDERPWGAAAVLAQTAESDPEPSVRRVAIIALNRFIGAEVRPAIEKGAGDSDAGVRAASAEAMGYFKDARSADRLGQLLSSDDNEQVRVSAAKGLGRNATDQAKVLLADAMEKNPHPAARAKSLEALGALVNLQWEKPPDPAGPGWPEATRRLNGMPAVRAAYERLGLTPPTFVLTPEEANAAH